MNETIVNHPARRDMLDGESIPATRPNAPAREFLDWLLEIGEPLQDGVRYLQKHSSRTAIVHGLEEVAPACVSWALMQAEWTSTDIALAVAEVQRLEAAKKIANGFLDRVQSADSIEAAGGYEPEVLDALQRLLDSESITTDTISRPMAKNQTKEDSAAYLRFVMEDRPRAVDVTSAPSTRLRRAIIEGLWPEHSFLGVGGEEGDGKTTLVVQLLRELLTGEKVLDYFDVGEARPLRVLFVDTEMEEDDRDERHADMVKRGLLVPSDSFYWLTLNGTDLSDPKSVVLIENEIRRVNADLLWIDSGGNAIEDGKEDVNVKAFFNNLSALMKSSGLLGTGLTLHPRKRSSQRAARNFDDLFGSREWKGRLTVAIFVEKDKLVCWKDRGGRFRRLVGPQPGKYPQLALDRPGLLDDSVAPFVVRPFAGKVPSSDETEKKVRGLLASESGTHTKNSLAKRLGVRKQDALDVIDAMIARGEIGPDEPRAKLHLIQQHD